MQQLADHMFIGALIAALLVSAAPASGQPGNDVPPRGWQLAQQQPGPPTTQTPSQQGPPLAQSLPRSGGELALSKRVEQLEEQLVDLQVVVGTLQSLARSGTSSSPAARNSASSYYGGAESGRIDVLDTQIRALTAQVEQIANDVRALSAQGQGAAAGSTASLTSTQPPQPADLPSFGSTTITAGSDDAIGGFIENQNVSSDSVAALPSPTVNPRAAPRASGNPKQLYETAYGYLMQRDYGAAQAAFKDFLSRYPNDSLAGNAQYWLGEAYFVRGQYKAAAGAFLKGYQNYSGNARAPDSLLKLAMSLDRLGQKDAACSSYAELSAKFPDAPQNVKMRAKSERQRGGCP